MFSALEGGIGKVKSAAQKMAGELSDRILVQTMRCLVPIGKSHYAAIEICPAKLAERSDPNAHEKQVGIILGPIRKRFTVQAA